MKKLLPPPGRLLLPVLACWLPVAAANAAPATLRPVLLTSRARPVAPITGRVTDEKGEGLPGVTILVKGTQTGTSTNVNGEFTLDAPAGATLVFSSVGYVTQEVAATGAPISLSLRVDNQQLNEVVVLGYVSQDRQNLTSAVSSVDMLNAQKAPVATITEAIQGRAPGIQVNSSGNPGQSPNIVIRGLGSLNGGSSPLYVVDGLWTDNIRDLNTTDIEALTVLKDASSTSIYGSRGANGVIIITTKRGKAGKPTVGVAAYAGVQNTVDRWKLTNASQWAAIERQAYTNAGLPFPASVAHPENYADTDWQSEILRTGTVQDYNVNLSGGTTGEKYSTNFLVSGGVFTQKGALIGTDFNRYTLRLNSGLTYGRLKINESVQLAHAFATLANGQPFQDAIRLLPTIPVYDPSETTAGYGYGSPAANTFGTNPVGSQTIETRTQYNNRIQGSVSAEYSFFDFLSYKLNLGVESLDYVDRDARRFGRISQNAPTDPSFLTENRGDNTFLLAENTLNFNKHFGENGLNVVLGYSEQRRKDTNAAATARSFVNNAPGAQDGYVISAGTGTTSVSGGITENAKRSFFSQVVYDYKNRYLVTGSFRRDYSSRFSLENRYGNFGAGSVGWRISEEDFFKSAVPFINTLKARVSYGVNGNDNIGDYRYQGVINQNVNYPFNGQVINNGQIQTALPSTGIKWESRYTTNYGLDFGLLDNRLTFSADYYISNTKDALVFPTIPAVYGNAGGAPVQNIGELQNKGFEFQAAFQQSKGEFTYGVSGNLSTVTNRVIKLSQEGQVIGSGATQTAVGHPVGAFFLIPFDGVFQTQDEVNNYKNADGKIIEPFAKPGDAKYLDTNGDGQINDDDRVYYNTSVPKLQFGLSANAGYKGFDLSFLIQGSTGNQVFNVARATMDRTDDPSNFRADFAPWTPDNRSTTTPRALQSGGATSDLQAAAASNSRGSSRFLENGSYARLKNVTLGYTLPKSLIGNMRGFSSLRVYVTGQNLVTATKYSGPDPEFVNGEFFQRGVDYSAFPNLRTYIGGIQLGF